MDAFDEFLHFYLLLLCGFLHIFKASNLVTGVFRVEGRVLGVRGGLRTGGGRVVGGRGEFAALHVFEIISLLDD